MLRDITVVQTCFQATPLSSQSASTLYLPLSQSFEASEVSNPLLKISFKKKKVRRGVRKGKKGEGERRKEVFSPEARSLILLVARDSPAASLSCKSKGLPSKQLQIERWAL